MNYFYSILTSIAFINVIKIVSAIIIIIGVAVVAKAETKDPNLLNLCVYYFGDGASFDLS